MQTVRKKLLYSHAVFSIIGNICVVILWLDMNKTFPWFVFTTIGCALCFIVHNSLVNKADSVCS